MVHRGCGGVAGLKKFYLRYQRWLGSAAYEPKMMTALLLYSYCLGEQSSREIEKACEVDVAFSGGGKWEAGPRDMPVRAEHEDALKGLFEVLRLCRNAGW